MQVSVNAVSWHTWERGAASTAAAGTTALCAVTFPLLPMLCFMLTDSLPLLFNCFTHTSSASFGGCKANDMG